MSGIVHILAIRATNSLHKHPLPGAIMSEELLPVQAQQKRREIDRWPQRSSLTSPARIPPHKRIPRLTSRLTVRPVDTLPPVGTVQPGPKATARPFPIRTQTTRAAPRPQPATSSTTSTSTGPARAPAPVSMGSAASAEPTPTVLTARAEHTPTPPALTARAVHTPTVLTADRTPPAGTGRPGRAAGRRVADPASGETETGTGTRGAPAGRPRAAPRAGQAAPAEAAAPACTAVSSGCPAAWAATSRT